MLSLRVNKKMKVREYPYYCFVFDDEDDDVDDDDKDNDDNNKDIFTLERVAVFLAPQFSQTRGDQERLCCCPPS